MPIKSNVKIPTSADSSRFAIKIGSVLYQVNIQFKESAKETLEKKIIRLARNEVAA